MGIGWARVGGESSALLKEHHLAVDGIENVIDILEDVENGLLPEVEFLELNACTQGCVGGCLTVENPYTAKSRIQLMKYLPVSKNKAEPEDAEAILALAKRFQSMCQCGSCLRTARMHEDIHGDSRSPA